MKARPVLIWTSVIVIALGMPILGAIAINAMAAREWNQAADEARSAGVPLDMSDALAGSWNGADSQNAAEGVKEVLRSLLDPQRPGQVEFRSTLVDSPRLGLLQSEADQGQQASLDLMRDVLPPFETTLDQFQIALERPHWDFKRDWTIRTDTPLPELLHLEVLNGALAAKALVSWKEDPAGSIRALRCMVRLANHLQSEPILKCIQTGVSCRTTAYKTASVLARTGRLTAAIQEQLLEVVKTPIPSVNWPKVWHVENAYTLAGLELPVSDDVRRRLTTGLPRRPTRPQRPLLRAKATMAKLMVEAEAQLKAGKGDTDAMRSLSDRYYVPIHTVLYQHQGILPLIHPATDDAFGRAVWSAEINECLRRLTYLSILMDGARSTLPLEASRPEWLDPFSGKPFLLAKGKLYSVGPNGKDDHGTAYKLNGLPLDIVGYPGRH